jgi:flavodoxin
MKTLIVFYSRTGNTKAVAKELAQNLNADLEEITETKPREEGVIGKIILSKDAILQNEVSINDLKRQIADYDLVVIGTPIWAWNMANPIRSFLNKYKQDLSLKKVAFFATMGSNGDGRAFIQMEKLIDLSPVATIAFTDGQIKDGNFKTNLVIFEKKISIV